MVGFCIQEAREKISERSAHSIRSSSKNLFDRFRQFSSVFTPVPSLSLLILFREDDDKKCTSQEWDRREKGW